MSRTRRWWSRCLGFTLIELLVVISIIALLISLLLPSLGQARDSAVTLKCLSNMHQLGVGFHQYQADFKQLPGIQFQSFVYAKSWGKPNAAGDYRLGYGGMQLWNSYGQDIPPYPAAGSGQSGFLQEGGYGYLGIGYVARYNGTFGPRGRDLSIFRCPTVPTEPSGPGGMPSGSWAVSRDRFFEQIPYGGRILTTYWYRGGAYTKNNDLADSDPTWAQPGSLAGGTNWDPMLSITRPDSPVLNAKNYLTCYSYGYVLPPYGPFPADVPPSTAAHKMKVTNLAKNDGSAKTLNLGNLRSQNGHPFRNIFGWYDGNTWKAADMYAPGSPHNSQLPYWWVIADRGQQ